MTTVFVSHPSDKLEPYFGAKALAALEAIADVRLNPEARELSMPELIDAIDGCDVLIAYRQTPGPEALFARCPSLAAFVRCAVDIRTVDVAAASAHGVLVTQASAGFAPAVAEWVVATLIDLGRGIGRYAEAYHRGTPLRPAMGRELRGSTLGVVGYGQIARYLCDLASAFGMSVLVSAPETHPARDGLQHVAMPTLLAGSDFVVCLAPANAQTAGMFDAAAFAAMQPGAFFVNAARGELVNEAALLAALQSGRLGGCALDVGSASDQMPNPELARHPLVIATPHIGGLTVPATEHQALETVAQIASLLGGEIPTGAVNAAHATRVRRWLAFS
jgi:D-3-phosphoglycerate dehydrogenase